MKKVFEVALGILTAIGGFVDIGDLVFNAQVGARFGMSAALVTILGALNLVASVAVTLLTFIAEIGGVALAIMLVTSISEVLIVPFIGLLVWAVLWRARFSVMENVLGLLGLGLVAFTVALWQLGPSWGDLASQAATFGKPAKEDWLTYGYFAVGLFGAAMTPYEVFFFSSGGVEERWTAKSLGIMRANVLIGFPLGGLLSLSIAGCAALVLGPLDVDVAALSQVGLPVAVVLGKIGFAIVVIGFVAATFGAACETGLSAGYSVAQFFGWQWGKFVRPRQAARFHLVLILATLLAIGVLMTGVDPIMVTEISVVFSSVALPLTYFPILVVANDRDYMGDHANKRVSNALGTVFLALVVVVAVAAIPLMVITHMGAGV
jgi:Mn2+/Fe2+ NRAMP family transporter